MVGTKQSVALGCLVLSLVLTACGGKSAASVDSPTASASATPAPITLPDLSGKTFQDAFEFIQPNGLYYEAVGDDGKTVASPPDNAVIESTEPKAGVEVGSGALIRLHLHGTDASLKAAAAASARATRYDFSCTIAGIVGVSSTTPAKHFNTVKAVWADPDFKGFESCDGQIGGTWWHDHYTLEPDEQAVVNQIGADGGDISDPSWAFSDVLEACLLPPKADWGRTGADSYQRSTKATAKSAAAMCPDAPFAAQLQHVGSGNPDTQMPDGTYAVGKDIAAGSYQVQTTVGVHDCYWERTTAQGGTIANDMITFAP
ncbi:PASTA domain-containing protein [Arthrobacter sp. KN11-1C]|uniref:PASTA domain-containing protein n=1 Tax=Arthrobacter sp. KN11-1C TaxID=3445774 RepID=UPI003F9F5A99